MPNPLTDAQLADIRNRCNAASQGPWHWRGNMDNEDPRLVGRRTDVLGHVPRERREDDPEAQLFRRYLHDVQVWDTATEAYRPLTDDEITERVRDEWLNDPWGEPQKDSRLAFGEERGLRYLRARELAVFEVCPAATTRADPRVYRADIVGLRHPNAEFIARARADVPLLLDEVARLRPPDLEERFGSLARQWRLDTGVLSNVHDIVVHHAYQRIIGMGPAVLPHILRDMQITGGGHWFWALAVIVGEDKAAGHDTVDGATAAWLQWGRDAGLLPGENGD